MFLVLGGSGFIGIHLINRLKALGNVRVFANDVSLVKEIFPKIDAVEGDFSKCNMTRLLQDVDVVYHMISTTIPDEGTEHIKKDIDENLIPTINLLDQMVKHQVKKIIFCSSGGTIYGEYNNKVSEDAALNPICTYGVQKLAIEQYLRLYEIYHNIKAYSVRITNPYGLRFNMNVRQGIIPIFINNISLGKPIEIWGSGHNLRDYIYIDDVVKALLRINSYSGVFRIFNIGTGTSYSLNQITSILFEMMNKSVDVIYKDKRKCDVYHSSVSIERAHQELRWVPKYTINDGIKKLIELMGINNL